MRARSLFALILLSGPALAAAPGERPGDAAMTCAEIGTELQPAALAIAGSIDPAKMAAITPTQKDFAAGSAAVMGDMAASAACQAGAAASMGLAGGACDAALTAMVVARETARTAKDSKRASALKGMDKDIEKSLETVDRARVERLMALAEEKNCS